MRTDAAEFGQVSDALLIEINSFAKPEPSSAMPIATLIHDFLIDAGRTDLVRRYELDPFSIHVMCVERTLCEKLMGLVRAGYEANPAEEFRRRVPGPLGVSCVQGVVGTIGRWSPSSMPEPCVVRDMPPDRRPHPATTRIILLLST